MSTTLNQRRTPADTSAASPDPLCQHEFDDGGLCALEALPGVTRCDVHQGDGQPDYLGGAR